MHGYIYETTNLINGKTYIGKKQGNFDKNYYGSGVVLQQAIKKYGKDNFKIEILSTYQTEEELNNAEIMFIEIRNPSYNIAKGGTGGNTLKRADDEYKKTVASKRNEALKNVWKNLPEERRKQWGANISRAKKGKATRPTDYKHSDEVKKRIKETNIESSKNRPASWKKNHAMAAAKRRGISNITSLKPIIIDEIVYDGVCIAARKLNVSNVTIFNWIKKGKAKYVEKK